MAKIKDVFEKATVDTIKQILATGKHVSIIYEHNGAEDPYYKYRVAQGVTEIFSLDYVRPEKFKELGKKSVLHIDGKHLILSEEAMKELNDAASDAWWTQKRREEEAKEKAKNDEARKRQDEISSFLAKFLPKEETH